MNLPRTRISLIVDYTKPNEDTDVGDGMIEKDEERTNQNPRNSGRSDTM